MYILNKNNSLQNQSNVFVKVPGRFLWREKTWKLQLGNSKTNTLFSITKIVYIKMSTERNLSEQSISEYKGFECTMIKLCIKSIQWFKLVCLWYFFVHFFIISLSIFSYILILNLGYNYMPVTNWSIAVCHISIYPFINYELNKFVVYIRIYKMIIKTDTLPMIAYKP